MTTVSYSVEIDASPERVWAVIANPRNLVHWDRHIVQVRGVPESGLEHGVRYAVDLRIMAVHATVHAEVREWDPPYRAMFHLTGVLAATVTSTVDPIGGGGSRLEHVVEYRFGGGAIGNVAASSLRLVGGARFALRRGTLAQKREIEAGG
ncbi:MAG TPA: SRPBCC family protein [Actinomycetota bacterium]|nr:SRPBCC family protein [Actinomycetota bacterium]